jgi:hypothetical protein
MSRKAWSHEDEAALRGCYAHWLNTTLAEIFDRPAKAIGLKARKMGLRKAIDLKPGQFAQGQAPWNAGRKGWQAGGRARDTQFKKGCMAGAAQHNYVPIGSERISKDGYVERKVTDDPSMYPARRWVGVHRLVWESVHGQVPAGHVVVFREGKRTKVAAEITPESLELVSRAELMRRNSYHNNYPKDVALLIQLKGALNRKINNRSKS